MFDFDNSSVCYTSTVNFKHMDENKVIQKLIEHDEQLADIKEKMADVVTVDAFNSRMDKAMVILERLDQERVFTVEWIRRTEGDVEKIKRKLHIA